MEYTSTIISATKTFLQEDGTFFLDVAFEINKGDERLDEKRLAFPLETSSETILEAVGKYVANYAAEAEAKIANAERDAAEAQADATIAEIVGKEITPDINTPETST